MIEKQKHQFLQKVIVSYSVRPPYPDAALIVRSGQDITRYVNQLIRRANRTSYRYRSVVDVAREVVSKLEFDCDAPEGWSIAAFNVDLQKGEL